MHTAYPSLMVFNHNHPMIYLCMFLVVEMAILEGLCSKHGIKLWDLVTVGLIMCV